MYNQRVAAFNGLITKIMAFTCFLLVFWEKIDCFMGGGGASEAVPPSLQLVPIILRNIFNYGVVLT